MSQLPASPEDYGIVSVIPVISVPTDTNIWESVVSQSRQSCTENPYKKKCIHPVIFLLSPNYMPAIGLSTKNTVVIKTFSQLLWSLHFPYGGRGFR
jgi:hypothetical protein